MRKVNKKSKVLRSNEWFEATFLVCICLGTFIHIWEDHIELMVLILPSYFLFLLMRRKLFPVDLFDRRTYHATQHREIYFKGITLQSDVKKQSEKKIVSIIQSKKKQMILFSLMIIGTAIYSYVMFYAYKSGPIFTRTLPLAICLTILTSSTPGHFLVPMILNLSGVLFTYFGLPDIPIFLYFFYIPLLLLTLEFYRYIELDLPLKSISNINLKERKKRAFQSSISISIILISIFIFYSKVFSPFIKSDREWGIVYLIKRLPIDDKYKNMLPEKNTPNKPSPKFSKEEIETMRKTLKGALDTMDPKYVDALAHGFNVPPELLHRLAGDKGNSGTKSDSKDTDTHLDLRSSDIKGLMKKINAEMENARKEEKRQIVSDEEIEEHFQPLKDFSEAASRIKNQDVQNGSNEYGKELEKIKKELPPEVVKNMAEDFKISKKVKKSGMTSMSIKRKDPQLDNFIKVSNEVIRKKEELKKIEYLKNLKDILYSIIKIIFFVSCIIAAGLLLLKIWQKCERNKNSPEKLDRKAKRELFNGFRALKNIQLDKKEEVVRKYQFFLKTMKTVYQPKDQYMPPTDYLKKTIESYPQLQEQLVIITSVFCDTFYGELDVTDSTLTLYRNSIENIVRSLLVAR